MKSPNIFLTLVLFLALLLTACSYLLPQSAPTGQYSCDVLENGSFTNSPVFQVLPGGKLLVMGKEGAWTYDTDKKIFTFSGDVSLVEAKYKKGNDTWLVAIQPAFQSNYEAGNFVNADEGTLRCYLTRPDQ